MATNWDLSDATVAAEWQSRRESLGFALSPDELADAVAISSACAAEGRRPHPWTAMGIAEQITQHGVARDPMVWCAFVQAVKLSDDADFLLLALDAAFA
ncbi:hypothetical protein KIN34_06380 [Cellulomonas sp. DKR-3]|uniref:Uncharacterized protein n=1 Tax=Cellulomonas fulva TaxID=2835530 RepID=A0ABS5TXU4_9CELL|nr:hypothetical protein [Cellulomonas fulva]MBT0993912.1 hypothetical protein [Cellulomonas fulva]